MTEGPPGGQVVRALVIDDSSAMRTLLRRTLRELGFDVGEAKHGLEGLACLRGGEMPAIVLVDWNMPEMGGLEFVRAVRQDEALKGLVVMMVTTESGASQVEAALSAGANEYLMKPFTKDALVEKLELLGVEHR